MFSGFSFRVLVLSVHASFSPRVYRQWSRKALEVFKNSGVVDKVELAFFICTFQILRKAMKIKIEGQMKMK